MSAALRFRIEVRGLERDLVVGAVYSLGCLGVHEEDDALLVYFPAGTPAAKVLELDDPARGIRIGEPEPVAEEDWERAWRAGLGPRRVGPLWIRPSWCEPGGEPEIVIDPQQAFGSGEHATTRLALSLLLEALRPGDRLLDLGTGSGILALAGLRQGARAAVGVDIDPAACRNAAENRARNGLPLALCCATLDALDPRAEFEIVVANLLASRLAPWRERLAGHCVRELVLSGYLAPEAEALLGPLRERGWQVAAEGREAQSGDEWCASRLVHTRLRQSSSNASSVASSS